MSIIKIPLTGKRGLGKFALIDADDTEKVIGLKWHVTDKGYARSSRTVNGKTKNTRMHHLILPIEEGKVIDHINHDKLDNRKRNLRLVNPIQNNHNRKRGLRYYYFDKSRKLWRVSKGGKYYGSFKTEEEASQVARTLIS